MCESSPSKHFVTNVNILNYKEPVYNIAMQNLSEGEKDDAENLAQKVDAVFKSKSEGDDQMYCYVNQFPRENEREETNQMPVNDSVEDLHPPWKRHCSVNVCRV